ncbi:VirB8/TrbF family protein [Sphingomonas sp. LB-2]|uniref:virB8 family protein n=1 Tax=Sphingomonas caeni TaxID=2984949 RepID=UPI00223091F4|nr:VirB8/TrbF family protein [Sphingomonas caeni]MCW3848252.1 VirB8/TrbF family protein [Sphingomonas caeni]
MKMKAREALDTYYEQAEGWGKDQQDSLRGSRKLAWIVASVAALIAVIEALALWQMMPLKTVEPYTLLVDKNTGYVQVLKPLEPGAVAGNTALTQSFLVQYVIARESYDVNAVQANYRKVALWSEGQNRAQYIAGMQASNPESPINLIPRSSVVETRVKSVTPMAGNTAMIRFDTVRRDGNGGVHPAQSWVAVVKYKYSGEPMSIEDRYVNPLGFMVTGYQRSAETLNTAPDPDAEPGVAAPAQAAPGGVAIPQGQPNGQPSPQPSRGPNGVELTL